MSIPTPPDVRRTATFADHFASIPDPRRAHGRAHELVDIIVLAFAPASPASHLPPRWLRPDHLTRRRTQTGTDTAAWLVRTP